MIASQEFLGRDQELGIVFPRDLEHPPREFAERSYNIRRWTEMPRGGHFAALEEPQLLAEDIRAFFRELRRRYGGIRASG